MLHDAFLHLSDAVMVSRLDQIIADARTRQPTRDEHCTMELYTLELRWRKYDQAGLYVSELSRVRYRINRDGYADPSRLRPECGA